jgi:hypothetical protein
MVHTQQYGGTVSKKRALARVTAGAWVVVIGVVHTAVGLLLGLGLVQDPSVPQANGRAPVLEMLGGGVVNAVQPDLLRMVLFWFLFFGFVLLMLGSLMRWAERQGMVLPRSVGWQLAVLGLSGGLLIPESGFWLVLPVAALVLYRAGRDSREPPAAGARQHTSSMTTG